MNNLRTSASAGVFMASFLMSSSNAGEMKLTIKQPSRKNIEYFHRVGTTYENLKKQIESELLDYEDETGLKLSDELLSRLVVFITHFELEFPFLIKNKIVDYLPTGHLNLYFVSGLNYLSFVFGDDRWGMNWKYDDIYQSVYFSNDELKSIALPFLVKHCAEKLENELFAYQFT